MNKRIILTIISLLALATQMSAEDKVTINGFSISAGETKSLYIELENDAVYAGFQFDLYLPDGITVGDNFTTDKTRIPKSTTLTMTQQEDGSYRFLAAAMNQEDIKGSSGNILTIEVTANTSLESGSQMGYFRNIKLSKVNGTGKKYAEMPFPIIVLAPSTVTANSYERVYGEDNPVFYYSVKGGALDGSPEILCEATPSSPVGTYDIIVKRGTETNFKVTYVKGTLTITKAPLIIKGGTYSRWQGEDNPEFTLTYEGFKNGETADVLSEKPVATCEATKESAPGKYPVTVTGGKAQNYTLNYMDGIMTIVGESEYIFADPKVKEICLANWDRIPVDGRLSISEIAGVFNLDGVFKNNTDITSFNELQYFYNLRSIDDNEFSGCTSLQSIALPDITYGMKSIGDNAFYGCCSLTSINIPSTVVSIGNNAFYGCCSLTSINIPSTVVSIGMQVFVGCSALNSIIIQNGVTEIGYGAFWDCISLSSITLPNSVTTIGGNAFYGCEKLASLDIPNSVSDIFGGAFRFCTGLTTISIPNNVKKIMTSTFEGCCNLVSVSIGNQVESIEEYAFLGCSSLASVVIPNCVKEIGVFAFSGCDNLTSITVERKVPVSITSDVFPNRANATLYVPVGCKAAYEAAAYWKEFKEIVETEYNYPEIIHGDVNDDGTVNAADIVEVVNFIMGNPTEKFNSKGADANGDGTVNAADIVTIVNIIMGN